MLQVAEGNQPLNPQAPESKVRKQTRGLHLKNSAFIMTVDKSQKLVRDRNQNNSFNRAVSEIKTILIN